MENIPVLPTAYFPDIYYIATLSRNKSIQIEQWETYPKQTLRNHCYILTGNGPLQLTVPVSRPQGNHTLTRDILVNHNESWEKRHWRAIVSAYNNSPYFLYYSDPVQELLKQSNQSLIEFNTRNLQWLMECFGIECTLTYTESFTRSTEPLFTEKATNLRYTKQKTYYQVFSTRYGFVPGLSALDLLFNLGPEARYYILEVSREW